LSMVHMRSVYFEKYCNMSSALAHLYNAIAAPFNIRTFQSVKPSPRSPPLVGVPGSIASDCAELYTDAYDGIVTKSSVMRTGSLLMQLARVVHRTILRYTCLRLLPKPQMFNCNPRPLSPSDATPPPPTLVTTPLSP